MKSKSLSLSEHFAIVSALRDKADDDDKAASNLTGHQRLADTLRAQAQNQRKLAETIELADTIEVFWTEA